MKLAEGIAQLGIVLPPEAEDRLAAYLAMLVKWNKVYNLTAVRDPEEMVTYHLLDSLAVLPELQKSALSQSRGPGAVDSTLVKTHVSAANVMSEQKSAPAGRRYSLADIGSGAGLPGLVLAIAQPQWKVASVEAIEKKAAFQRQVVIELGLTNVSIHSRRVEGLREHYDAVITRAFASLADFVRLAGHLADRLWAMKGAYPADEVAALPAPWRLAANHVLRVPGLAAARCLLQLERLCTSS